MTVPVIPEISSFPSFLHKDKFIINFKKKYDDKIYHNKND